MPAAVPETASADIVKILRSRRDTKVFEENAIRVNVNAVSASIPALMHDSLRSGRNAHQRLDDLIELFIRPQIHDLLGLCLLNKELAESVTKEMRDSVFEQFSKEMDKYNETWKQFTTT